MDAEKYKIGVIGLGPVGLTLATHFKEAGCDVHICDVEKRKINLIRSSGIELVGRIEKLLYFNHVYSSVDDMLNNDIDVLISSVKAYHVNSIMEQIQKEKIKNTLLLIAQNGIEIRRMYHSLFNDSNILRMVINFAGNLNAPNVVNVTFFNPPNYIASIDDSKSETAQWLSDQLTGVNLETKCLDSFSIEDKVWEKTILNAALSPLCAISRLTMREAMAHPDTLVIIEQLILEAMEVGKAEDIKFGDNFVKLCIRYLKNAGDHFPSLAVDLLSGRETEIDFMNGKIVEFGKKHYIRTPLNLTFTNLVKAISHKNAFNIKDGISKELVSEGM
ncbi:MAG: 2-dehydropantoate 2-reductase [Ignavibacteriaceae bacterium]|nr:MAG: 2-dehydropantoate 2-reductase [Ignavibacteriaceae bacterium]